MQVDGKKEVAVAIDEGAGTYDYETRVTAGTDAAWVYLKDIGAWYINCEELDTKDEGIHTW